MTTLRSARLALAGLTILCFAPSGCDRTPKPQPDAAVAPPPKPALDLGHPRLTAAVQAVLDGCQVDPQHGGARRCKDANVNLALQAAEQQLGPDAVLRGYCEKGLLAESAAVRAFSLRRISVNGDETVAPKISAETYACLVAALRKAEDVAAVATLGRVGAYVSTALKKEGEFMDVVATLGKLEATLQATSALWPHGRMRVWTRLEAAAKGGTPEMRTAAVQSFSRGAPATDEEREKVCGLLAPMIADKVDAVAHAATAFVAQQCPDKRGAILAAAAKLVAAKRFGFAFASALRNASGPFAPAQASSWSAAHRGRAIAILQQVVTGKGHDDATRAHALSALFSHDPQRAARLAKPFDKPDAPRALRMTAAALIPQAARIKATEAAQRAVKQAAARQAPPTKQPAPKQPAPKK